MTNCQNPLEISGVETVWQIVHQQFRARVDFEDFTDQLEHCLGRFDPAVGPVMTRSPREARALVENMQGEQDLMIFLALDHGHALSMVDKQGKAVQYLIGNPLMAIEMARHQIGAALYAPLRVLVYEAPDGKCVVEYDQPSSLFGQFGSSEVHNAGLTLDRMLVAALRRAVELASQWNRAGGWEDGKT